MKLTSDKLQKYQQSEMYLNNLGKYEKSCGKTGCHIVRKNTKFHTQLDVNGCTATGCGKPVQAAALQKLQKR